ncbi:MAG: hypothetical protein JWN30_418 [Bacilli bacterium]|nr:hypothetical protein [Bacilli bacterium]
MTLVDHIRQVIDQSGGSIPFDHFMELALYHPGVGYYMNDTIKFADKGDFYTAPTLHPIFAKLVSRQLVECWHNMGAPTPFAIEEWGAGNAALSIGLLQGLLNDTDAVIHYTIIERSPQMQSLQQAEIQQSLSVELSLGRLAVNWVNQHERQMDSFTGVIVSNELFDALPAKRYQVHSGRWQELGVTYRQTSDQGRLQWLEVPLERTTSAVSWLNPYLPVLDDGDRVDVAVSVQELMQQMASSLHEGYILTFDYGDTAPEVYENRQFAGNIRTYYRQILSYNPYERVGEQDLTTDVNFSLLLAGGAAAGARNVGFSTQAMFLEKLGFLDEVRRLQQLSFQDLRYDQELQTMLQLYVSTGLGTEVKVLALAKGDVPDRLSAFGHQTGARERKGG